jgi:hypothetical protein
MKAKADTHGSGTVVNIKIHTSHQSSAVTNEDIPLCEFNSLTAEPKVC